MSFRKVFTVLRENAGMFTNGEWVAGARSSLTTNASIQSAKMGRGMKALPEGRHMSDFVKIYSADRLVITADGEGAQPDILVHAGYGYELVDLETNQSDVINHYKYDAVKIFKFTSISDWLSGILKRV